METLGQFQELAKRAAAHDRDSFPVTSLSMTATASEGQTACHIHRADGVDEATYKIVASVFVVCQY